MPWQPSGPEGERLGATPVLPVEVTPRIVTERSEGRTFQAIAEALMTDGIPTARGKTRWYLATIKAVAGSDHDPALQRGGARMAGGPSASSP